jgi:hypothetical protein
VPDSLLVSFFIVVVLFVRAGELTPTQVLLVITMALSLKSHAKRARTFFIHRVCARYASPSRSLMGALVQIFWWWTKTSHSPTCPMSVGNHVTR